MRTLLASDYTALPALNGVSLVHEVIGDHHNVIDWMEYGLFLVSQTEHLVGFPGLRAEDVDGSTRRDFPGRNLLAETFGHIYYAHDPRANNRQILVNSAAVGSTWSGAALAKNSDLHLFVGDAKVSIIGSTIIDDIWDESVKFEFTNLARLGGGGTLPDIVYEEGNVSVSSAFSFGGASASIHDLHRRFKEAFDYGGDPAAAIGVWGRVLGPNNQEIVGGFAVYEEEENGEWSEFRPGLTTGVVPNLYIHGVFGVKRDSAFGSSPSVPEPGAGGGSPGGGAAPPPVVIPPVVIPMPPLPPEQPMPVIGR